MFVGCKQVGVVSCSKVSQLPAWLANHHMKWYRISHCSGPNMLPPTHQRGQNADLIY